MIDGKKVLAILPARGGSKGVKRKNIKELAGKPLLYWTIAEAKKSKYIDRFILSSEDQEIMDTAKRFGLEVPFVRPKELAEDNTPGIDTVLHAVESIPDFDYVVLLQPTSPFRMVEDIDGTIETCVKQNLYSCVTVTTPDKSPYWMYTSDNGQLKPLLSTKERYDARQQLPEVYVLNGAVYVAEISWLKENKAFVTEHTGYYYMKKEHSLDIDTELDFDLAELLLTRKLC